MAEEILVPLGFFVMVAAIWIAAIVFGARAKRDVQETLRQIAADGRTLTPDLISALQKPVKPPEQDMRSGVILTALSIGLAACGGVYYSGFGGDSEGATGFFFAALIVGAIGIGQLAAWWVRRREPKA